MVDNYIPKKPTGFTPKSNAQCLSKRDAKKRAALIKSVVILDFETDPFDNLRQVPVWPFCAVLYSHDFTVTIWKEDGESVEQYRQKIVAACRAIPGKRYIFAHNGGKFDFMFLMGPEMEGRQIWKGRSLMDSNFCGHKLRDSSHIMPGALRTYKKDDFDYDKLLKKNRAAFKSEILSYCISDCRNAYEMVVAFLTKNGLKLTIGQAALAKVKETCGAVACISEHMDGKIRGIDTNYYHKDTYGRLIRPGYYHGGRVECIMGKGIFLGNFTLYDVNSMYPSVMANCKHPIGANFTFHNGPPNINTAFIHLRCHNNGAFVARELGPDKVIRTTADIGDGEFYVTIHEYNTALSLGLISNVEIIECVDNDKWGDFSLFVYPLYAERQKLKEQLDDLKRQGRGPGDALYDKLYLDSMQVKLYLNNAYGKFGQNPRNFDEIYLGSKGSDPPWNWYHSEEHANFTVWWKKKDEWDETTGSYRVRTGRDQLRFHNIATAASITGAARAKLLHAIHDSSYPIYCDTDSIIARSLGSDTEIDATKLGAWKPERELREIIICGKKVYSYIDADGGYMTKCKGASGMKHEQARSMVTSNTAITLRQKGVTIKRDCTQEYLERVIVATGQHGPSLLGKYLNSET